MDVLGDRLNDTVMVARAIHFAATAIVAGVLTLRVVVTQPVLPWAKVPAIIVRTLALRTVSISLAVAVVSGAIWFLLQAFAMSGQPLGEAAFADVVPVVLSETQFGTTFKIRIVMAVLLAACLAFDRVAALRWPGLALALGLVASIAWTGHAGSGIGGSGVLHLAADLLHLTAAAAWLGGLLLLALLLFAACRDDDEWRLFARQAVRRFSVLGIVSVGTLILTGIANAYFLVGSISALTVTNYGRLLMLKLGLFVVMLTFAAANRFLLTPRLDQSSGRHSLRALARNSSIEVGLGLAIYGIVGVLGTLHPAIHFLMM